jgi:hypothetical protein
MPIRTAYSSENEKARSSGMAATAKRTEHNCKAQLRSC